MSSKALRLVLLACLLTMLTFVLAACGDDDDGGSASDGEDTAQSVPEGKKGGSVTVLSSGDVDYMDPGQTFYTYGYQITYSMQRPLYYFSPEDPEKKIPDLADGEPTISDDLKTITVKIKPNVKYSPPVNREVKAADVEYAMERVFSANVPQAYALAYFSDIVGAPKTPSAGVKDIEGITATDDTTLEIKLSKPSAGFVAAALVMPLTIPVPKEYAEKFDAKNPSTYNENVVFTGPYMIKNDSAGKLVGWKPGKSMQVVRNPNWDESTDFRPAYLDTWNVQMGNDDTAVAGRRILQGTSLVQGDSPPAAQILKQASQSYKSQLSFSPSGGTRYVAMNTTNKPFDNVNVRKAILAVFDRNAMRLTRGGAAVGDIAWSFLPPGFPGYEESGGLEPPEEFDYLQNPEGDLALAQEYMKKAGYASGKYEGDEEFLTIATNADPGKKSAEVAAEQFRKLGFKLNVRIVPQDTLYTKFCSVPKSDYDICPNVGFFKDFFDGQALLGTTFWGPAITENNNYNWPLVDDPKINSLIEKAQGTPVGDERNQAWADANLEIVRQAIAVPWVWDKQPIIVSKNVNGVNDDYSNSPFMAFLSLK
jgi:peptide/nickel transport system substrate-binding protein